MRNRLAEIDDIVKRANEQSDLIDQAYLMQLAVIKLSGHIDYCVERMIAGYLEEHTSSRVLAFAKRQAERLTNLNPAKLEQIVGSFDPDWQKAVKAFLDTDENRQSLGNLIAARHKVAHGGTTKATAQILTEYRKVASATVDVLFDLFLPLSGSTPKAAGTY
ncbi:HEPN domain-containing protein [Microbacterium sp. p3-SID338]|uniref:HEPN domain-containing protein n=1 Tax=Microbacterium sp. p3-SID338 TaxID=2916214 RepID=UPI0021A34637|nr:HEPN domain-containing protein [Microbacterium sp. p3-SID338]MCT1394388.1 HEPN domain-containing protein [Microbacterium sp. p3-SID338]